MMDLQVVYAVGLCLLDTYIYIYTLISVFFVDLVAGDCETPPCSAPGNCDKHKGCIH